MKVNKAKRHLIGAKNPKQIASAIGIESAADVALMEYKALLSELAAKAIESSGLTVNELVKRSDVARSKVSAIKNGALAGISSDLFLKVIAATGGRVTFKLAS
ncbi:MAG: XRE family transcriptional regulator [Pseudobdellovibrionaceae bacterium]